MRTRHHALALLLAGAALAATATTTTNASAQEAPYVEKYIEGTEAKNLSGVIFRPGLRSTYGVDQDAGRLYRFNGMFDATDGNRIAAASSIAIPNTATDVSWAPEKSWFYLVDGATVRVYDLSGAEIESFEPFEGNPASGIAIHPNGQIVVAEQSPGKRIRFFNRTLSATPTGLTWVRTIVTSAAYHYHGVAHDELLSRTWGADGWSSRCLLRRFDNLMDSQPGASIPDTQTIDFENNTTGCTGDIQAMDFDDPARLLYVAHSGTRISIFDPEGNHVETWTGLTNYTRSVAAHGDFIWTTTENGVVTKWVRSGTKGASTFRQLTSFNIPLSFNGGGSPTVTYDHVRDLLWVNYWQGRGWQCFDADTGALVASFPGGIRNSEDGNGHSSGFGNGYLMEATETAPGADRFKLFRIESDPVYELAYEIEAPDVVENPAIAFDPDRDVIWRTHWNGGNPSDIIALNPFSGVVEASYPAGVIPAGTPWGHSLDYAENALLVGTETEAIDGLLVLRFGPDADVDLVADAVDNCDATQNSEFTGQAHQVDGDNDGLGDLCDNCPLDRNVSQSDTDKDGVGDSCDNCLSVANAEQTNSDDDTSGDACDSDSDNDNIDNASDNCPTVANPNQENIDSDDFGDACDDDIDGDGVSNDLETANNLDPTDPDTDNDTISDGEEFGDRDTPRDTNGDGTIDALDDDSDGDGISDADKAGDADLTTPAVDSDSDGRPDYRDIDSDGDSTVDLVDNCPGIENPTQRDSDRDGIGDACDPDRDGDGVSNDDELALSLDPDNPDTDGDTISDGEEVGSDASAASNTDSEGDIDALDDDSDGDGISDADEAGDGSVATPAVDTDSDAKPDFQDDDSDDDGEPDATDNCRIVSNSNQLDTNQNGIGDACEGDSDGDGVADEQDNCPGFANPDQANVDGDSDGDACDADDDNDGADDGADNCPLVANDQTDSDNDGFGDACDACPVDDGSGSTDGCPTGEPGDADAGGSGDVAEGGGPNGGGSEDDCGCSTLRDTNDGSSRHGAPLLVALGFGLVAIRRRRKRA